MAGLLTIVIAYLGVVSARNEDIAQFRASLVTRPFLFIAFVALVVFGLVSPMLILFGVVELIWCGWTWWGLRSSPAQAGAAFSRNP